MALYIMNYHILNYEWTSDSVLLVRACLGYYCDCQQLILNPPNFQSNLSRYNMNQMLSENIRGQMGRCS